MKTVEMKKAKAALAKYAREAAKEPIIVMDKGKPVAAVVAIEKEDIETISVGTNAQFLALIERSRARQKTEGGITSQEMRRRLKIP